MSGYVEIGGLVGSLQSSRMADLFRCWLLPILDGCCLEGKEGVVERRDEALFGRTKRGRRASCQAGFGSDDGRGTVWLSKRGWRERDR